jgi:hypothetical protein
VDWSLIIPDIRVSAKAKTEIISAAKALGDACSWSKLKEITGYAVPLIQQALRRNPHRPKTKGPPRIVADKDEPVWVEETKKNTGMDMLRVKKYGNTSEWLLLSPTGVPIVRVVGYVDVITAIIKISNPAGVLQGITALEIANRKKRRASAMAKSRKTTTTPSPEMP